MTASDQETIMLLSRGEFKEVDVLNNEEPLALKVEVDYDGDHKGFAWRMPVSLKIISKEQIIIDL